MYGRSHVIIMGKNYCTSLGVIRALGRAGYKSIVIKVSRKKPRLKTPELFSKYVVRYEQVYGDREKGVLRILEELAEDEKKLIIPTDDDCAYILDRNYGRLSDHYDLPTAGKKGGRLAELMDKSVQKQIARENGIRCAESATLRRDERNQYTIPQGIPFPCFVKPSLSAVSNKNGIRKCGNREELQSFLDAIASQVHSVIVEEYIDAENEYVLPGLSLDGDRVIIPGVIKKTKVGEGSLKGITAKGIPVHGEKFEELLRQMKELMKSIHLTGLFDIEVLEFKGMFYFNELNLRNGAAGYGITGNGVNLPAVYADCVIKGMKPEGAYSLSSEKGFVSEKVELDSFVRGDITFGEMMEDIRSSCIRFIRDPDDRIPYLHFIRFSICKILMEYRRKK